MGRLGWAVLCLASLVVRSSGQVCVNGVVLGGECLCYRGFGGSQCSAECSARGHRNDVGVCVCDDSRFSGEACEIECSGNGHINRTSTLCICDSGFAGDNCQMRCNGRGILVGGNCVCDPGYSGADCTQECSGKGILRSWGCQCAPPWGGASCSVMCSGRGSAPDASSSCNCQTGYSGRSCEIECSGYGRVQNGICACSQFHSGALCQLECSGRGHVVDGRCQCNDASNRDPMCVVECNGVGVRSPGTNQCVCPASHTGANCETPVVRITSCENGGVLDGGACVCLAGYSGIRCQTMCSGHGSLVAGLCQCDHLWSGPTCSIGCNGKGTPVDGNCVCDPHFSGSECEIACHDQGVFVEATRSCQCSEGYSGVSCNDACEGRGRIIEGACVCKPAYTGARCEQCVFSPDCTCPSILGDECDSICSGLGFVKYRLSDGRFRVLPQIDLELLLSTHNRSLNVQTNEQLVTAWLRQTRHLRPNDVVVEAVCECPHPAFSGPGCEVACSGRGKPSDESLQTLHSYVTRCSDSNSHCLTTSTQTISDQFPVTCTCEGNYGSISRADCVLCSGQGRLHSNVCECNSTFVGRACQLPCNGRGDLKPNGKCRCEPHIKGQYCQKQCDWLCKGGDCKGEACICRPGYSGPWCDMECGTVDGENECNQVLTETDLPIRYQKTETSFGTFWSIAATVVFVVFVLWLGKRVFQDWPRIKRQRELENRARYMNQRGPVPVYESYDRDDPDRRTDAASSDSDEVEIDLHVHK